jgi:GntR family transcriptional regulator / MocR family aminotransferase
MGFAAADAQTTEKTMQKFRTLLKTCFSKTLDLG